ncbi:tetrapyrrole biosynthesis, uroporphyrinogen III synthase [Aspergillus falconensis]
MTPPAPYPRHILLLKTKSSPHDGYEEFFSSAQTKSTFIPVLSHNFHTKNLSSIKNLIENGSLVPGPDRRYGGLIFTSQRAVEAFAETLGGVEESYLTPSSQNLPLYTVGPATARSLTTLRNRYLPHATIHGAETGNGENLARFILEHYNALFEQEGQQTQKKPLLFLVGETRRDIIPKTLMGCVTDPKRRIGVEEVVAYETGVVKGFEGDFERVLQDCHDADDADAGVIWVVVFSPTGCDAMVRVLRRERERVGGRDGDGEGARRKVLVATIGPTTRDHLVKECGFEPDVCAAKPSPEGVGAGIEEFMKSLWWK